MSFFSPRVRLTWFRQVLVDHQQDLSKSAVRLNIITLVAVPLKFLTSFRRGSFLTSCEVNPFIEIQLYISALCYNMQRDMALHDPWPPPAPYTQ